MKLVEVWAKDGKNPSLLVSGGWVENGDWSGDWNKEKNTVFIKFTKKLIPYFYLGDCEYNGDYNETFKQLENGTLKILGKNLIKYEEPKPKKEDEETDF